MSKKTKTDEFIETSRYYLRKANTPRNIIEVSLGNALKIIESQQKIIDDYIEIINEQDGVYDENKKLREGIASETNEKPKKPFDPEDYPLKSGITV